MESPVYEVRGTMPDVELELLKLKSEEAAALANNAVRTISIYLAVTGGLLKFAFDTNATPQLRIALSVMGIVTSALLILAGYFGERHRRCLRQELNSLRVSLLKGASDERVLGVRHFVIGAFGLGFPALIGWITLICLQ